MPSDIIIFDDDESVSSLTSMILEDAGYTVTVRNDGKEAVNAVKEAGARLVVLDIMMPGVDGMTVLRLLKEDPQTRDVKVVMMSSKSYGEEKKLALDAGANLYIVKPFGLPQVKEQITALIGKPSPPQEPEAPPLAGRLEVYAPQDLGARLRRELPAGVALASESRRLLLFHHDPSQTDTVIGADEAAAQRPAKSRSLWVKASLNHRLSLAL